MASGRKLISTLRRLDGASNRAIAPPTTPDYPTFFLLHTYDMGYHTFVLVRLLFLVDDVAVVYLCASARLCRVLRL